MSADCPDCAATNRSGARFCRGCGIPLAAPLQVEGDLPHPAQSSPIDSAPDSPIQRRRLRHRLLIAGSGVLLLLVAYGAVAGVQSTYTPDKPVKDLFAALGARDGARAGELVGCATSPVCQTPALANGYEPPQRLHIVSIGYGATAPDDLTRRPNRNHAYVVVRYQLAGSTHEDSVGLQRAGLGLFRRWHISRAPGSDLDVISTTVNTAKLGGAQISIEAPTRYSSRGSTVRPLPGVYVLAAVETALVGAMPATVVIAGDVGRQRMSLEITVKAGVVDEVTRQVRARIDACAAQVTLRPDVGQGPVSNCPFDYSATNTTTIRNVRWTIAAYPQIELRKNDDESIEVHTLLAGQAKVAYEYTLSVLEPRRWNTAEGIVEITVGGGVDIWDGKIVWLG